MAYDGDGNRVSETAGGVTTTYLLDTLNPTGYSQVLHEYISAIMEAVVLKRVRLNCHNSSKTSKIH